jgi:hypothetical protein
VQFPATRSCFRADDYLNLYQINNYSLFQYLIIPNAGHLLVARNAVFYLCWLLFGPAQAPYLWLAYLTHLLNVWLLFRVIEVFTHSRAAALFGAALWGACPLHAAIGYYAVYGHVMVGTIVLVILLQSGRAAEAGAPPTPLRTAAWYGLAITAALCFGTGMAFAMLLPFVLALMLPHWRSAWRLHLPLVSLLVVVPVLYVGLHRLYEATFDQHFDLGVGLRVMASSVWSSAPVSFVRLVAYALSRQLTGFLPGAWTFPAAYALLAAFVAALVAMLRHAPAEQRRRVAACIVLAVGCYALIAVSRGFADIIDFPADSMRSGARFHYVALIPVAMLLAFVFQWVLARRAQLAAGLIVAWCALTIAAAVQAPSINARCVQSRQQLERALARIHDAITQPTSGETIYIPNRSFPPVPLQVVFPGSAALFTIYYPDNVVDGRHVQFIEPNPMVREFAQKGRRSRSLLVPPQR